MEQWSIYTAKKALPGVQVSHYFMVLYNETRQETLKELHFSAYKADGSRKVLSMKPLNLLAAAADKYKLLSAFKAAADKRKIIGKYLVRIKGVQTSPRQPLENVDESSLCFSGTAEEALGLWNAACRQAISLNKTDTPFIAKAIGKTGVNCRSATEMVLEGIGIHANDLIERARLKAPRDLRQDIPGLDKVGYEGSNMSLEDLLQENKALGDALFATRPQAAYRQPATP